MNDLNEFLDLNQIGNILNYYSSNNFEENTIYKEYVEMIDILSNEDLENAKKFFINKSNIIEFINFHIKLIYPIFYLFNNSNLTLDYVKFLINLKECLHL